MRTPEKPPLDCPPFLSFDPAETLYEFASKKVSDTFFGSERVLRPGGPAQVRSVRRMG